MKTDPIRGKTIRWTFRDGPMKGKTFEHIFERDGAVAFRMLGGKGKLTRVDRYEYAPVGKDVYAVSYLGPQGFTLTVVLDFRTLELVAFSSSATELGMQRGTFETDARKPSENIAGAKELV